MNPSHLHNEPPLTFFMMRRSASLRETPKITISHKTPKTPKVLSMVDPDQYRQVRWTPPPTHHIIPLYTIYVLVYTFIAVHTHIHLCIHLTRASKHPIYTPCIHLGKSLVTASTASSSSLSVGRRVNCAAWCRLRTGKAPCMGLTRTTKPFYMP